MSPLTVTNGNLLLRDGKLGTEQACCCNQCSGPCADQCCVLIAGRNTCEPGDAGELPPDGEYEAWGIIQNTGYVFRNLTVPEGCDVGPFPGLSREIGVSILSFDPVACVTPIIVYSWSDRRCPPPGPFGARWHSWDGVLVTDANGCPTGISLDQSTKITKYGDGFLSDDPAEDSGVEPLNPEDYVTFDCNPLP